MVSFAFYIHYARYCPPFSNADPYALGVNARVMRERRGRPRASSTLPVMPVWPVPKHSPQRIISGPNPITAQGQIQSWFFMVINKGGAEGIACNCVPKHTISQL
jgi:hypothetical protein